MHPRHPHHQVLRRGDVLTHLDGVPIADDGTFLFREAVRIDFRHIASCAFDGDAVKARTAPGVSLGNLRGWPGGCWVLAVCACVSVCMCVVWVC